MMTGNVNQTKQAHGAWRFRPDHHPALSWCYHWRPTTTPVSLQHESFWFCDSVIFFFKRLLSLLCMEEYKLKWKTKASPWQFYSLIQPFWASTDAEKMILFPQKHQSLQEMLCRTNQRRDIFSRGCLNPCIMCKCNMWWLYHPLFQQHKDPFIFCLLGWE